VTGSLHAQTADPAPIPTSDLPKLKAQHYDPQSSAPQREQAASRLLVRPEPDARVLLGGTLLDYSNPAAQFAAARALALNPTADPSLITPLFALIDPNNPEPLISAAAQGLTAFKTDNDVLTRLLGLATNGTDERIRLAAIRASGTFVDKRVANALVALMDPSAQPPSINNAAAEAMDYMTGQKLAGNDFAAWSAWWQQNQGKADADFKADLLVARATRYDAAKSSLTAQQSEILRLASERYQKASRDDRADLLLRFMRSTEPTVRAIGCQIARQAAETDVTLPQAVKEQLRDLIGDADPAVRSEAADALALVNDADAIGPLLTQLNQETDSSVRHAIADALRPIRDIRSVEPLMKVLDDPSVRTAQAAAEALSEPELGQKLRDKNPVLADKLAAKLLDTLQNRTTAQNNIDLRNSLIQAMAALQNRTLAPTLVRMLDSPREASKVRRSLLQAVGEYHDPQMADSIGALLSDPDEPIRLEAVKALGKSANSFGDFEKRLYNRIDPAAEPSPAVQDAAWNVLTKLFEKAPKDQLASWEIRLRDKPDRLLAVLKVQRDRALSSGDADEAARRNQQIGDAAAKAAQSADAGKADALRQQSIEAYRSALSYAEESNKTAMASFVSEGLTNVLMAAHKYADAINFVQQQIKKDPAYQGDLVPLIGQEASRLVHGSPSDFDSATQLIDMALKMNPPPARQFTNNLQELRAEVQRRSKEQNLSPYTPLDGLLNARAD
ncbi:MAG: HEAT repeat domain-containing protein, partial [Tepidisphaeraceae bacterium]